MCGIAGLFVSKNHSFDNYKVIENMTNKLSHRGPDNISYWSNSEKGQFLGHSRLSIIDLSENGNQPMVSNSSRYILSYNGEIYNHIQLRKNIDEKFNVKWNSTSDTETILKCIENLGVESSVAMLEGMFAFALLDRSQNLIYLARDQMGEKPLYYGFVENDFIFASELKSILCHPNFKKEIDHKSLNYFLKFSYVPEPNSIFKNIKKVKKSCLIKFDLSKKRVEEIGYNTVTENDKTYYNPISESDAISNLDEILNKSVSETMISDVDLGCFLSGGTDSSLIAAIMQSNSKKPIKTFSVTFENKIYNESFYSKNIAKFLNTDHHELVVSADDLLEQAKVISEIYDEPFADSSQIPTSLISKFASEKVKVALSGDGADEFYGGYNRYLFIEKFRPLFKILNFSTRKKLSNIIQLIPSGLINYVEKFLISFSARSMTINKIDEKINKFCLILENCKTINDIYYNIITNYQNNNSLLIYENVLEDDELIKDQNSSIDFSNNDSMKESMMQLDQKNYLTGDILHKVDRASMKYSLETRMPFLNPSVINYSKKIPTNMKIKGKTTKWIIKKVLSNYIPEKYIYRPKMGFSIPLENWLRGPLKNWSKDILKLDNENLLNHKLIQTKQNNHYEGKENNASLLWNIIIWKLWSKKYL